MGGSLGCQARAGFGEADRPHACTAKVFRRISRSEPTQLRTKLSRKSFECLKLVRIGCAGPPCKSIGRVAMPSKRLQRESAAIKASVWVW